MAVNIGAEPGLHNVDFYRDETASTEGYNHLTDLSGLEGGGNALRIRQAFLRARTIARTADEIPGEDVLAGTILGFGDVLASKGIIDPLPATCEALDE